MNSESIDKLELRALEQRGRLHQTTTELKAEIKTKIDETKEKFDVKSNARKHFTGAAMMAGVLSFLSGFGIAGAFTRN